MNRVTIEEHQAEELGVQQLHYLYTLLKATIVMDSPHMPQDPVVQELQKHAHQIAEEGKAQQAKEWAEDDNIVSRLVSTTTPSEFRAVTSTLPRQYAIH